MTLFCAMLAASTIGLCAPQGVQDPGPPRGGALLMLAYEAIKTGKPGPDANVMTRLRASLDRNPSARTTLDRLLVKWKKVPNKNRLLGAKFGSANMNTRFTEAELRSAFNVTPLQMTPLIETVSELPDPSNFVFQLDSTKMNREQTKREASAGPFMRDNGRAVAIRPRAPRTLFKMEATGMYCVNEGVDWGNHSEPYVLFVMWQQSPRESWSVRMGPAILDTGGNFLSTIYLFSMVAGSPPIFILPVVLENDGWDPDQVQDWVQAFLDTAMPRLPSAYSVRCAINAAIMQFRGVSGDEDDDLLGIGQYSLTLPLCPALAAGSRTAPGGQLYDFAWVFNGGSNGAYYVLVNVSRA